MSKSSEKRRKKDKKRHEKNQENKQRIKDKIGFSEDQKKFGKIQIFIVVGLFLAAAMFIIVSLNK